MKRPRTAADALQEDVVGRVVFGPSQIVTRVEGHAPGVQTAPEVLTRLARLEAKVDALIRALQAGAVGCWT